MRRFLSLCCMLSLALAVTAESEVCPENEEMRDCAKPKWCNSCDIRGNCKLKDCRKGCDCIEEYYRDGLGVCVPKEKCDANCRRNEIYYDCGRQCEQCDERDRVCIAMCAPSGCYCKQDYYRNRTGCCVRSSSCDHPKCPPNEEMTECVTPCTKCEYRINGCPVKVRCETGCDCKPDYARDSNGDCIRTEDCPR